MRSREGGNTLYVIGTIVVLIGIALARMNWHGTPDWAAFNLGASSSQTVRVMTMPTVTYARH